MLDAFVHDNDMLQHRRTDKLPTYGDILANGWTTPPATTLEDLPPELLRRIASTLQRQSAYSTLLSLPRTSRLWSTIATPEIYREVGHEHHHVAALFDRFTRVKEEDRYLFLKRWDKYGKDGHPMDWPVPMRLMWYTAHVKKIVYRPVDEDHRRAEKYAQPDLNAITDAWGNLYPHEYSAEGVFPALESLVLDLRHWREKFKDETEGNGVYWDSDEFGHGVSWDEDGYYFDNPDVDEYGNIDSPYEQGALLNSFIEHVSESIYPDYICLSLGPHGLVSLNGTVPMLDLFYRTSWVVLHDFGYTFLPEGLPTCFILVIDWHEMYKEARSRLSFLQEILVTDEGYLRTELPRRILFTRSTLPGSMTSGYDPNDVQYSDGTRDEDDKAFTLGFEEMLKDLKVRDGEPAKLDWGYIDEEEAELGRCCKGCNRKFGVLRRGT